MSTTPTSPPAPSDDGVILVVPFRDGGDGERAEHLRLFLEWHERCSTRIRLIVVEQSSEHKFNRGLLLNIGRARALELYPNAAAIIYHDVDLIPSPALTTEYETRLPTIDSCVHFGSAWGFYGQTNYVGGVLSVHPRASPVYPTQIYGWGKEDDLWLHFWKRQHSSAGSIVRVPRSATTCYTNLEGRTMQEKQQFLRDHDLKCGHAWEWVDHYKRVGPPAADEATPHDLLRETAGTQHTHLLVRLPGPLDPPLRSVIAVAYNVIAKKQRRRDERSSSCVSAARARHNFVKMCLLYEARDLLMVSPGPNLRALDLASGKGGDRRKWASLAHDVVLVGADISRESVAEARRRDRTSRDRVRATYHVASMLDPDLDLGVGTFHMVACMFAAHYACESDETLACFFENVAAHLREGGVCICVFPDYYAVEQHLRTGVPIPGVAIEGWTFGARGTGHKYTFRMEGCVACPEFQVHPDTWRRAASNQDLEILQSKNLTDALRDGLRRAPQLATDMRVRPEHLSGDLRLTQLYCACILRKRRARKRTRRP